MANMAVSWGDPHLSTYDMGKFRSSSQFYFDNMNEGYVTLAKSKAKDLIVQTEQAKLPNGTVANVAAAVKVGPDTVSLDARSKKLKANGKDIPIPDVGQHHHLPGGGVVERIDASTLKIKSSKGDTIYLNASPTGQPAPMDLALNVGVEPSPNRAKGDVSGNLGVDDADDKFSNDFTKRDGVDLRLADLNEDGITTEVEEARLIDAIDGKVKLNSRENALIRAKIDTFNATWMATEDEVDELWGKEVNQYTGAAALSGAALFAYWKALFTASA